MGNRWSLLVVREWLTGPARYGQLQAGLPGISTNLLTDRLRELEEAGVVLRQLDSDSHGVVYALTPWGQELRSILATLVNWSKPLMVSGPQDDSFQPQWLIVALEVVGADPLGPPICTRRYMAQRMSQVRSTLATAYRGEATASDAFTGRGGRRAGRGRC